MGQDNFEMIGYALNQAWLHHERPSLLPHIYTGDDNFFNAFMQDGLPRKDDFVERFCNRHYDEQKQREGFRRRRKGDSEIEIHRRDYDLEMAMSDVLSEYQYCLDIAKKGSQSWKQSSHLLTSIKWAEGLSKFAQENDVELSDGLDVMEALRECYNSMLEGATKYEEGHDEQERTYCAAFIFANLTGIENLELDEQVKGMHERDKGKQPSPFERILESWKY